MHKCNFLRVKTWLWSSGGWVSCEGLGCDWGPGQNPGRARTVWWSDLELALTNQNNRRCYLQWDSSPLVTAVKTLDIWSTLISQAPVQWGTSTKGSSRVNESQLFGRQLKTEQSALPQEQKQIPWMIPPYFFHSCSNMKWIPLTTKADAHEKRTVLSHSWHAGTAKMLCYLCVVGVGGK